MSWLDDYMEKDPEDQKRGKFFAAINKRGYWVSARIRKRFDDEYEKLDSKARYDLNFNGLTFRIRLQLKLEKEYDELFGTRERDEFLEFLADKNN